MQYNPNSRFERDASNAANNNISSSRLPLSLSEEPATLIHTSFAKVYTMPLTSSPKLWTTVTQNPVPISFYLDKQRNVYRILSYDGDRLVINSTIIPTMAFMKPSSSFGLWNDVKLRVIFGLGFASQLARDMAGEWFDKVVKAAEELEQSQRLMTLPPEPHDNTSSAVDVPSYGEPTNTWNGDEGTEAVSSLTLNTTATTTRITSSSYPLDLIADEVEEYPPIQCSTARVLVSTLSQKTVLEQSQEGKKQIESTKASPTNVLPSQESNPSLIELNELKVLLSNTNESLHKKISESEKLRNELKEVKELLEFQIRKTENIDKLFTEEQQRAEGLEITVKQLKSALAEQSSSINEVKERKREIEQGIQNWKEKLRSNRCNLDEAAREMENVKAVCRQISDNAQDLMKLQERLEKKLNLTKVPQDE